MNRSGGRGLVIVVALCALVAGGLPATAAPVERAASVPAVVLSASAGPPGTSVAARVSGFAPREVVDLAFDGVDVAVVLLDSAGSASKATPVPRSARPGKHVVTVTGRKSQLRAQASFTVRTDWNQFGFDSAHTGSNPYETTLGAGDVAKLTRTWRTTVDYYDTHEPTQFVVASGLVVSFNSYRDTVTAVSVTTGAKAWTTEITDTLGGITSTPVVIGSTVVLTTDGFSELIGLDLRSGTLMYRVPLPENSSKHPLVAAGGSVFTQSFSDYPRYHSQTFSAFDPQTGATRWNRQTVFDDRLRYCSGPAVASGIVYTTCEDNLLHALRAADGAPLWTAPAGSYEMSSPPVVVGARVLVGLRQPADGSGAVIAYDAKTGYLNWLRRTSLTAHTAPVSANGRFYLRGTDTTSGTPVVAAFDVATGSPSWRAVAPSGDFTMSLANGLLYVPGGTTTPVLDVSNGTTKARLDGGKIAVVTDAGVLLGGGAVAGNDGTLDDHRGNVITRYDLPVASAPAS